MSERFATFDFGLDDAQEERASRLHRECVIVDTTFQGPIGYRDFDEAMNSEIRARFETTRDAMATFVFARQLPIRLAIAGRNDAVKERWDESGVTCGNVNLELAEGALARTFSFMQKHFDSFPWLTKALTAADVRHAHATGTHAGLVSTQVLSGPWRDLETLRQAYDAGLRMCQLTYNTMTTVGAGCTERTDAGLSEFGVASVRLMNELGIIVDTGHCGRQTTLDACEVSTKPVVASHTAAEGRHAHARAKSDEELHAIAATGGTIGIVTVPSFVADGPEVTIESTLDHVEYVAEAVGVDHVGIGTDWPLPLPKWVLEEIVQPIFAATGFRDEHGLVATQDMAGFTDYRDFPNITRGLVARGWADEDIAKVLGENFLRVMECCG